MYSKKRVSITLPTTYLEALERLIQDGIYLSRGEIILEALRNLLESKGVPPFSRGDGDSTSPHNSEKLLA